MQSTRTDPTLFVNWFRATAPYIHAHRGSTFVIAFGGEAVTGEQFPYFLHDIALLHSLGIRLVLVHGARPQIAEQLRQREAEIKTVAGIPVTDPNALLSVKEAVGSLRVEIEALLSMGAPNSPMEGARLRIASGNFVTAKPFGVREGVDYQNTGEVRRIDVEAIKGRLDAGAVVLVSPLGYSITGDVFNLAPDDVARSVAVALGADKLVFLVEGRGLIDSRKRLVHQITPMAAEALIKKQRKLPAEIKTHLRAAAQACSQGVRRAHLVGRETEGALLLELFTRDGNGTMVTAETYEGTRPARLADVGGILKLIGPLEAQGVLVRRPRKILETEIDRFTVVERDGMIIATAALYPILDEKIAELACVSVHPDYRRTGRGDALLDYMEGRAREMGLNRVFVLTTHAAHWFVEREFEPAQVSDLPVPRQQLYNRQRNSKVFIKDL